MANLPNPKRGRTASHGRHAPTERAITAAASLPEELVGEVLLRLPLAAVARCSAVCKPWRSLLRGDAFLARYRAFHRTPPVLGFFHNEESLILARLRFRSGTGNPPIFVPTAASCEPQPMPADWYAMDSRHGRVLFFTSWADVGCDDWDLVVWDPVGGGQWELFFPDPDVMDGMHWDVTVLCAVESCDHVDCHGGDFLVAFVVTNRNGITSACLYSSEADLWNEEAAAILPDRYRCWPSTEMKPCVLVKGALYFLCYVSKILKYDMDGQEMAVIEPPFAFQYDMDGQELVVIDPPSTFQHGWPGHVLPEEVKSPYAFRRGAALMAVEGGRLGFAGLQGSSIRLWTMEEGSNGVGQWIPRRVIELMAMLPTGALSALPGPQLIGLAECVDVLFIKTDLGVFTIELKTGEVKKVSANEIIANAIPYTSFHIPDNVGMLHFPVKEGSE